MKSRFVPAFLTSLSIGCLGAAYYLYSTLQSMYETLAYYGMPAEWMVNSPQAFETIWNLRIGIFGLLVSAVVLLVASFYLVRRNKMWDVTQ